MRGARAELEICHKSIESGHQALRQISGKNSFYTPSILLYSFGLERLLKIALWLRLWETKGKLPEGKRIIEFKHDVTKLHQELLSELHFDPRPTMNTLCSNRATEDIEWLQNDSLCNKLVEVCTSYSNKGRYHHLDRLLGNPSRGKDADALMTEFENLVAEKYQIEPAELGKCLDPYYEEVGAKIAGIVRRYYRAIARLFLYGYMGDQGTGFSGGPMATIFGLEDNELDCAVRKHTGCEHGLP